MTQHRKHLTPDEVRRLVEAALEGLFPERNAALIATGYLHGLRISELLGLRLSDLDLPSRQLAVHRLKNGFSTIHPVHASIARLLGRWLRVRRAIPTVEADNDWLFVSRSGEPLSRQQGYNILAGLSKKAGLSLRAHPHMLRHACGYALADNGIDTRLIQDYLGHRNIRHTVRYTASNAARFGRVWNNRAGQKNRQLVPFCKIAGPSCFSC
jgi:type 1 fimbriae regulatory protein FimB